uniref:Uncharacterized protein n=1 Tax=Arundo donax TaxID=35708 RepID=A0A0A8Z6D6_ARUDO
MVLFYHLDMVQLVQHLTLQFFSIY